MRVSRCVKWRLASLVAVLAVPAAAAASGDIGRVSHVVVVMQENHSFDNYLGVLPYAPQSPSTQA